MLFYIKNIYKVFFSASHATCLEVVLLFDQSSRVCTSKRSIVSGRYVEFGAAWKFKPQNFVFLHYKMKKSCSIKFIFFPNIYLFVSCLLFYQVRNASRNEIRPVSPLARKTTTSAIKNTNSYIPVGGQRGRKATPKSAGSIKNIHNSNLLLF